MTADLTRTKRVPEIELMKAIAILGMVFVHVLEGSMSVYLNAWEVPGSISFTVIEFFGCIPAAGAFTFAMGWGAAFSDRSTPSTYLKRASKLFLFLFYVNFVYVIFPTILDPENFGSFKDIPWAVIGFNIYSFATVCMLFFALMKKIDDKPGLKAGISIAIVIAVFVTAGLFPPESYEGNQWVATLLGIFTRQNEYSWFPLVPWSVFPITGYWAAKLYRRLNDRKKFALIALAVGAVFTPVCWIINKVNGWPQGALNPAWIDYGKDYYGLSPVNIIGALGVLGLELAVIFVILTLTKGKLHPLLLSMSRNVMRIFIAHWLFVSPLFVVLIHVTNIWVNNLIALGVLIATLAVVQLYNKFIAKDSL